MFLGRPLAALLCSALAAASVLKHVADADVEFSYGSPAGQVPVDDMRHYKAHDWPHPHRPGKDTADKSIYQVLSADDEGGGAAQQLVGWVSVQGFFAGLRSDRPGSVTLFALPDSALQFPKHKKGGHRHRHGLLSALSAEDPAALLDASQSLDLADVAAELDAIESASDDDDDEKKERRRKIIKLIVRAILEYHILPQATDLGALLANTTHATNLTIPDGALDEEALRIRVGATLVPPAVRVNFYSTVVQPNVVAKNGVIHVLDRPLLPPPSIFQTLFLVPKHFASLSSALQRVKLANAVEWRYVHNEDSEDGKWQLEGAASSTLFAPLNSAFAKLPWKLQLFLFSPFGERVLGRLLQFHVVPGFVLHSDYLHNATAGEPPAWVVDADVQGLIDQEEEDFEEALFVDEFHCHHGKEYHKHGKDGNKGCKDRGRKGPRTPPHHGPHHEPEYAANITLPTRLANHTVDVHVLKYKTRVPLPGHKFDVYTTRVFVNRQRVVVADVPARNGALHVVGSVLSPHPHHGKRVEGLQGGEVYDSWADWEEWLVDWAEAN
ncbi:FAS1 domain-containing protein [Athelia psychrophila]|uniref:FAS1 domain-containing protein n=1 Tax=Athelia psychrophila TaxID=1759441 RepID=A0A166SXS0_9AGAM|nr:FAS1 domain-containing protein [Fibularhizoctonia sp. CBS 109695]